MADSLTTDDRAKLHQQGITIGAARVNVEKLLGEPLRYEENESGETFAVYQLRQETVKSTQVAAIYVHPIAGLGTTVLPIILPANREIEHQLEITYTGYPKKIQSISFYMVE